MERIKVPASKVMQTLREVVAERPGYEYSAPKHMTERTSGVLSCFYVHNDGESGVQVPGCLVGAVLNRLGVSLSTLALHEGTGAHAVAPAVLDITGHPDEVGAVRDALTEAQDAQDNGATWGDALEVATRQEVLALKD